VDFLKLRRAFDDRVRLVRANYYAAPADEDADNTMRPLLDWLAYNGYDVREKAPRKRWRAQSIAIDLAIDALELAPHVTTMILFAGDDEYNALVRAVQQQGVAVVAVSTLKSRPAMIDNDLRRQVDEFIELADMLPQITSDRQRVARADAH
jgi:uncharacterized LabA/DUF88 family protein